MPDLRPHASIPTRLIDLVCPACGGRGFITGAPSALSHLPPMSMRVAIVGAGIGGAALALALQHRGIECKVYERDASFLSRAQGYGLTMQQAIRSMAGLEALGLGSLGGITSLEHTSYLPDGTSVGVYGRLHMQGGQGGEEGQGDTVTRPVPSGTAGNRSTAASPLWPCGRTPQPEGPTPPRISRHRPNFHISRQELRRALLDKLKPHTVIWGKKLARYEENDAAGSAPSGPASPSGGTAQSPVTLHFSDGSTATADVLVGSDGIYSVVRKLKLGSDSGGGDPCPLQYLGVMVILGIAPCAHPALERRIFQTIGGSTRIYAMPFSPAIGCGMQKEGCSGELGCAPSQAMWQLSFPIEEAEAARLGANQALLKAEALSRCGTWHDPIPSLLRATPEGMITGYPAYDRDLPTTGQLRGDPSGLSRVTLIGDAAHPMSPFKGQGANQALIDGVALARRIHQVARGMPAAGVPPSLPSALAMAEEDMLTRAGTKVQGSRTAAALLHSPAAVAVGNTARAVAAARAVQSKVDERSDKEPIR